MEKDAPRNGQWVLYYDGGCGLCTWVVHWLDRLDPLHRVQWVPAQSLEAPPLGLSWQELHDAAYLHTGRGRLHEGFYAFRKLTTGVLPLLPLAPVFWFPGMSFLGVPVYRWVARNRYRISRCRVPGFGAGPSSRQGAGPRNGP